jgi:HlyD family secretion protein
MKLGFVRFHIGILVVAIFLIGCNNKGPDYFQGYVEGEYLYIAASTKGELKKLAVTKGQRVNQGEPLFQLDPNPEVLEIEELNQRIQQAESKLADVGKGSRPSELEAIVARLNKSKMALELAERDYQRRQKLYDAGKSDAIAEEELDRYQTEVKIKQNEVKAIEADLETAKLGGRTDAVKAAQKEVNVLWASLNTLKWQLDEKQVLAPATGIIQDILYRVGEFVPAGRPVISLLPPENIKIRFFVPQALLPTIKLGSPVRVTFDGMDSEIKATISFISPEAEFTPPVIYSKESRTKLVFMIEAKPDAGAIGQLRVGQPLEVYLN